MFDNLGLLFLAGKQVMATPDRPSHSTSKQSSVVQNAAYTTFLDHTTTIMASAATGSSPRKRVKLEAVSPATEEIGTKRRRIQVYTKVWAL